jgi:hypothetical protein
MRIPTDLARRLYCTQRHLSGQSNDRAVARDGGIADWRLSVNLKRAEHDLDLMSPEVVH